MLLNDLLKVLRCDCVKIRLLHLRPNGGYFEDLYSGPCTYSSPCPEFDNCYIVDYIYPSRDSVTIHASKC